MKERRLSKKKNQQILATLAMGINLVNSMYDTSGSGTTGTTE